MSDFNVNYDSNNKKYSKEEYAEYKRNEKSKLYELIDRTAEKTVSNIEDLKKYLECQSKFDNYSVGNALAVTSQMPKATQLRTLDSWADTGAYKKKFAKDVKILEPGDQYMREDGSVVTNYNVRKVYDISQVSSRQQTREMRYDDKLLFKLFLSNNKATLKIVDEIPDTNKSALYDLNNDVLYVARGEEPPKKFHDLVEELVKQELGNDEIFKVKCVSYMLCNKYHVNVSNYNIGEIPVELKNMEAKEIKEELEPIRNTFQDMDTRMNNYIQKLAKENKSKENVR